ncbi:MAG TPA: hypothetical protein VES19_13365 [Candidatus Limnocylindrales bacterium]|nr:hypothetical protein [Candidatus Limnocylindrales bacterium]
MPAGNPLAFVSIVGFVVAVGIVVGMITATRLDRIMIPVQEPRDPDPEPRATEEQQP